MNLNLAELTEISSYIQELHHNVGLSDETLLAFNEAIKKAKKQLPLTPRNIISRLPTDEDIKEVVECVFANSTGGSIAKRNYYAGAIMMRELIKQEFIDDPKSV